MSKSPVITPGISQSSYKQQNPPSTSKQLSNATDPAASSQPSADVKPPEPSTITQAKSQAPRVTGTPSQRSSPSSASMSVTYDKRMPPPSIDWRGKGGSFSRKPSLPPNTSQKDPQVEIMLKNTVAIDSKKESMRVGSVHDIMEKMVEEAQKSDAHAAKGPFITEKRDQLELLTVGGSTAQNDLEERKIMNGHLRDGDNRIEILSDSWEEVAATGNSNRKRTHDDELSTSTPSKKRKLRSEYCPASHTSWKPSWLDSTQCYPVDETGEDMSDVECLRGDGIHRSADKLKQILETECMYIPSHRVDELMTIAKETYDTVKRTEEFYANYPSKRIRIERHQFMVEG